MTSSGIQSNENWRKHIQSKFYELVDSTIISIDLATSLYASEMINGQEMDFLTNSNIPHKKRVSKLYSQMSRKWVDTKYKNLIEALTLSLNSRAVEILTGTPPQGLCIICHLNKQHYDYDYDTVGNEREATQTALEVNEIDNTRSQIVSLPLEIREEYEIQPHPNQFGFENVLIQPETQETFHREHPSQKGMKTHTVIYMPN